MPKIIESASLYFREGRSDKEYHARIEEASGGYVVTFAFGRRGSTLQTGAKTASPVPLAAARKIFEKLVASKMAKGYSPGPDGTPYAGTEKAERDTGLRPQLLNAISEDEAEAYLRDDAYWAQEKVDGRRVLVRKTGGEVNGINRSGLIVALPQPVVDRALKSKADFVLDGEAVGDRLLAFDCLLIGPARLEAHPYRQRWSALVDLIGKKQGSIEVLPAVCALHAKRTFLRLMRERNAEGVVFKRHDAPYTPGRPASGGPQVKLKFHATATCIVSAGRKGKRSVALEVLDGGKRITVGNVTIPVNQAIPKPGSLVEVRYLYWMPGGSLIQPVILGVRDDVGIESCLVAQLKPKRGEPVE
ncbi:MAG: WGR domain-containing protein [Planctomycetota bacterium]|nr:WGR domain-containing protein [Planctomycetota bacterium]